MGTWTNPRNWIIDEVVTAAVMNTHVRDNLGFLRNPPIGIQNNAVNVSTTSATFVDIDGTNLSQSVVVQGGDVMVACLFQVRSSVVNTIARLRFVYGATPTQIGGFWEHELEHTGSFVNCAMVQVVEALAAGTYTFKLQWLRVSGGGTLTALATTAHFLVREL